MIKAFSYFFCLSALSFFLHGCVQKKDKKHNNNPADSSLVNLSHLDHLYTPVTLPGGINAAGIYIYAEAPDYHMVGDSDEGFTCVDDVARAAQVYLRSSNFSNDTILQNKTYNLLQFILGMQSANGYFYNFLFPGNTINETGKTSADTPDWWSWRALLTLTEAHPQIKNINVPLAEKIDSSVQKLIVKMKTLQPNGKLQTKMVTGIKVPQWLPAGSATDQAAIMILALVNYCSNKEDTSLIKYMRTLADGIVMMQQGKGNQFPYGCILSWENVWHGYGCDQAYALLKAGRFLKDSNYIHTALNEIKNFYPWLLKNGMRSSFTIVKKETKFNIEEEMYFAQIAYMIRPMIFAALEAYDLTQDNIYADIAAELSSWFFGKNIAGSVMYDKNTGRCFDGILSENKINKNSGAESTIEALLAMQRIQNYPAIITTLKKYK